MIGPYPRLSAHYRILPLNDLAREIFLPRHYTEREYVALLYTIRGRVAP